MPLDIFEYWIDANLPPQMVAWLNEKFSVKSFHLKDIGLLKAADKEILLKSSGKPVIIITKDEDFARLLHREAIFPKVIWITVGNISNMNLKRIVLDNFEIAVAQLTDENNLVEITNSI